MPRGAERKPIDPNLPPDTPLEPGSGVPRVKPGSAAARIAASQAALGDARPAARETGGKSAAIAAARSAAKAAYLDTPVKVPKSLGPKTGLQLKWPFKRKAKAAMAAPPVHPVPPMAPQATAPVMPPEMPAPTAMAMPPSMPMGEPMLDAPMSRGKRILKIAKTLLIAASVAIIVVGTAQTALELLFPAAPSADAPKDTAKAPPERAPGGTPPATTPSRSMPAPGGALPTPPAADPEPTNSIDDNASFFDPHTMLPPKQPRADVTGSINRKPASARASQPANPPASHAALDGLPATISPLLRTAVAAADPAAEYELGMRYAEGRGMPQSMPEAVKWFERAANAGFAPAQFRLASLNEKGDGVKKNTQEARRLYIAAAAKGHAKAMHNLAVLYAEGVDGKPDYKVAAEWFRKAAMYGVADSQYNLAILYARGIGMPANLAESYRWFAIAAANGDQDAARKRDEVGARLDKQTLMTAKLAVQSFVPDHEPEDATSLKAPPGGWDHAPAPQAKPRRHVPAR
jgi:localization factor PodJL